MFDWARSRDEMVEITRESIQAYKDQFKPGSRKDAFNLLLSPREDGEQISEEMLVSNGLVMFVGGTNHWSALNAKVSIRLRLPLHIFHTSWQNDQSCLICFSASYHSTVILTL